MAAPSPRFFPQAWRRHWSQRCQRHRTCFTCQFPRRQWSRAGRGGATKGCGTCLWAACFQVVLLVLASCLGPGAERGRRDANSPTAPLSQGVQGGGRFDVRETIRIRKGDEEFSSPEISRSPRKGELCGVGCSICFHRKNTKK